MLRVDEKGSSDSSMVDINRHRQTTLMDAFLVQILYGRY